jgi:hypothetical protein
MEECYDLRFKIYDLALGVEEYIMSEEKGLQRASFCLLLLIFGR